MPQAYQDRKAAAAESGTCVRCRKAAPIEGKLQCVACRDISLRAVAASQRKVREECIAGYGGRCVCCGEINLAFLTIDLVSRKLGMVSSPVQVGASRADKPGTAG